MKAIETNVVLAGLMAIAITLQADQTTPPADPAFSNPEPVTEQTYQVLDTQEETTFAQTDFQAEPAPTEDATLAADESTPDTVADSATAETEMPTLAEATDSAEPEMEETPVAIETNDAMSADEPMEEETPVAIEPAEGAMEEETPVAIETNDATTVQEPMEEETPVAVEPGESTPDTDTLSEASDTTAESEDQTAEAAPETETQTAAEATPEEPLDSASVIIPLIVMDEVPLMDAIRNLARQAEINYMVDPRVPYGQMGPDGKITPQPVLSIRWENVTAQQALSAVLANYNLQMIEDPKSKIQQLSIKDPAAPDPLITQTIQLQYASPTNILNAIKASFTDARSKVVPDTRTSQLVIVATEKEMLRMEDLVTKLDSPTKQVLIEAKLIETSLKPSTSKGIDWSGTLGHQQFTFGNGNFDPETSRSTVTDPVTTTTTTPSGRTVTTTERAIETVTETILGNGGFALSTASGLTPATAFLNADGVSAVLSFLNEHADGRVISSPRTVTLDNEKATIEVGTLYPIVNVTASTANTTGGSQISYSNLTVSLEVTPRISANDFVNLRVMPRVMRLGPKFTTVVAGTQNEVDSFLTRSLETTVLIPSGNTLVMGGLIEDQVNKRFTKVPLLGDIPVLGYLFRSDSKNRDKKNLTIFVTPTIVQDSDFQPTRTDFLQTPVPDDDQIEPEWGPWDSGKPRDWSKRGNQSGKQGGYSYDPYATSANGSQTSQR